MSHVVCKVRTGVTGTTFVTMEFQDQDPVELHGIMTDGEVVVCIREILNRIGMGRTRLIFDVEDCPSCIS